jgi:hypothetical protein
MIVKPNTGVTVCGTGAGDRGLTRFRSGPARWTSGGEVGQLLLESCAPVAQGGRPIGRFEGVRVRIPPAKPQAAGVGVHEQHRCNDLGVGRRIQPCLVAIGVALRGAFERGRWTDLKAQHGADHFAVEVLAELPGRGAQVALHPLALGRAHLADPAILKDRQGREQQEQYAGDERCPRGLSDLHPNRV